MGIEQHCVNECPNELKQTDASATSGTCKTCAEATKTEENPDGERPFWDPSGERCVASCEQTSISSVCVSCEEAFGDSKKYFENN